MKAAVVFAVALLPGLAFAQSARNDRTPAAGEALPLPPACSGGPIQNGMRVQPTPYRDQCLAELRNQPLQPGNEDVRLGAQGVPQVQVAPGLPIPPGQTAPAGR